MRKEGDTILDEITKIEFLKGKSILSQYTSTDTNKGKEPILDRKLQRKWLPAKSEQKTEHNQSGEYPKVRPKRTGKGEEKKLEERPKSSESDEEKDSETVLSRCKQDEKLKDVDPSNNIQN